MDFTKQIKSNGQISGKFWPLDRTLYSWKNECSQMMDNTSPSNIPTKTQKVLKPFYILPQSQYEWMTPNKSSQSAKYQAIFGHLIEVSIAGMMNLA
jgi:hypothetical protein